MKKLSNQEYALFKKDKHTLIHVLSKEHYQHIHLNNAINICVYETEFLKNVLALKLSKKEKIVFYGESDNELDAKSAVYKLKDAGFTKLYILEAQDSYMDNDHYLNLLDGKYKLLGENKLHWIGSNANGSHDGVLGLKSGFINVKENKLSGEFIMDMHSIFTLDLSEKDGARYLDEHLKSDDFFLSKLFPEACFSFKDVAPLSKAYQTDTNYILNGTLHLRGIENKQQVKAVLTNSEDKLVLNSRVEIDRTKWEVLYGSSKFFKYLGMHKIFDTIYIDVRLELEKE